MKLRQLYDEFGETLLGHSATDLYELQRELQHVPRFPKGRPGPGGGAEATPEAVAVVVVALLAGGARRRTRQRTPHMMALPICSGDASGSAAGGKPAETCGLTSAATFGDAMREALADSSLAERIRQVIVCRDWSEAAIAWVDDGEVLRESRFADAAGDLRSIEAQRRGTLFSLARLGGGALAAIAQELRRGDD
ncbi:MAG: hypothetical protein ACR2QV_07025 [Gammaproteobacteria bacterium]